MKSGVGTSRVRFVVTRGSLPVVTAPSQPRRRIHGGSGESDTRYFVVIDKSDDSRSMVPGVRSSWRATFVGVLLGLLLVMVLLMKWLLEWQIAAAADRRVQEMAVRAAVARCFELASPKAITACRKALEPEGNSID